MWASCARRRTEPVATVAPGASSIESESDEAVTRVAALGHRGDREPRRCGRREILRGVDGEVGVAVEDRGLHLLDEHTLSAELVDRAIARPVAQRLDEHELDVDVGDRSARADRPHARLATGRGGFPAWPPAASRAHRA